MVETVEDISTSDIEAETDEAVEQREEGEQGEQWLLLPDDSFPEETGWIG